MGLNALYSNTDGGCNTAIGANALYGNTTAGRNTALGACALEANTTGNQNTAIGTCALKSVVTGSENTGVGMSTLNSAVTGSGNAGFGYSNMTSLTSGSANTSVGNSSSAALTTGADNTTAGANSGISLTTGSNNLLLGHDAGRAGSPGGQIDTESNVVVLGDENITDLFCADTSISSSDQRDKTDIEDFTHGLNFVTKLKPKTYKWDKRAWYISKNKTTENLLNTTPDGSRKKSKVHIGFMAQDVLTLEKEIGFANNIDDMLVVNQTEDETQYGLKYERLVPVLVNAIKELSEENKDLKSRIEALESN
jgi:hypothetical protein